jgi:hypothetical protein
MAIKREKIQPAGIHVRMMAGQPAYTQVVTVSGTGKMIFVAGQLARDPEGNCVGKGDMRTQIQQVGENIKTASKPPAPASPTSSRPTPMSPASTSFRSTATFACAISARPHRPARRWKCGAWRIPTS